MNGISYLERQAIDATKWDACISSACNGLIYAHSFYLDAMATNWGAFIMNDYEAVMPLAWNRKYSFLYSYQPYFTSHLGVFANVVTPELVAEFIRLIPSKFRLAEMDLNEKNEISIENAKNSSGKFELSHRVNQFVRLEALKTIRDKYHRLAKRMINKAQAENTKILTSSDPAKIIRFYETHYAKRHGSINSATYTRLIKAAELALKLGYCQLYEAKMEEELLAVYLVFCDEKFVYSVLGGSSPKGRESGAFYALTDFALQTNSETSKIFRFEGSDIKGIQSFNAQFGAESASYVHLKYNNLPPFVRWLK